MAVLNDTSKRTPCPTNGMINEGTIRPWKSCYFCSLYFDHLISSKTVICIEIFSDFQIKFLVCPFETHTYYLALVWITYMNVFQLFYVGTTNSSKTTSHGQGSHQFIEACFFTQKPFNLVTSGLLKIDVNEWAKKQWTL